MTVIIRLTYLMKTKSITECMTHSILTCFLQILFLDINDKALCYPVNIIILSE
jgi:hypothetical protein